MRKTFKLTTLTLLTLTTTIGLTSCGPKTSTTPSVPPSSSPGNTTVIPSISSGISDPFADADLIINYYRFTEDYNDWGLWSWDNAGTPGFGMLFDTTRTRTFEKTGTWKWVSIPIKFGQEMSVFGDWAWSDATATTKIFSSVEDFYGLIIRTKAGDKDLDKDLTIEFPASTDKPVNAYIVTGNETVFYDIADVPTAPIKTVYLSDSSTIKVENYFQNSDFKKEAIKIKDVKGKEYPVEEIFADGINHKVALKETFTDITNKLFLVYDGKDYPISFKGFYNSKDFNDLYQYDGKDLGSRVSGSATTYKLWSPAATEVKLNLYADAAATQPSESIAMVKGEKGVWSHTVALNMHAKYYNYTVTVHGSTSTVSDPYGESSNANGVYSMVVDWSKINAQVADAPKVSSPSGISVYETHVRDFSISDSWGGTAANKGKYLGLSEAGTKLSTGEPTGFDYVKSLGVSHVQLQPIYDFKSVDETKINDPAYIAKRRGGVYNWGYDPYNYAALEGSYSSNPQDGLTRINEFSQVADAYNKAGIGLIMDVVYNHMPSESDSTYNSIMPDYYFRTSSYSGAGSDLASENSMVQNMIIQTTESLAKNYKLAGFRFDLMGLTTAEAMKKVASNLGQFDEDIILYGEGWSMYGGDPYLGNKKQGTQGAFSHVSPEKESKIGFFNDKYRDGMKGNVFTDTAKGFLQIAYDGTKEEASSLASFKSDVIHGLKGSDWAQHFSGVSVNYTEAHDNLTLNDKLIITNPKLEVASRHALQKAANQLNALATGVAFYHAGTEFARSKSMPLAWLEGEDKVTDKYSCVGTGDEKLCFVNDSYNFSDEINAIDWTLTLKNADMVSSFKDAIAFRSSADAAALKPLSINGFKFVLAEDAELGVTEEMADRVIGYQVAGETGVTKSVGVLYNGSNAPLAVKDIGLATGATKAYVNGVLVESLPESLPATSVVVYVY